jgi:hypothetical protein
MVLKKTGSPPKSSYTTIDHKSFAVHSYATAYDVVQYSLRIHASMNSVDQN